jgi:hypothetical protein
MSEYQPPPEGAPPRRPLPPLGVGRAGGVLGARLALVAFSGLIGVLLIARGNAALGAALIAVAAIRLFIVVRTRQRLNAIRANRQRRLPD